MYMSIIVHKWRHHPLFSKQSNSTTWGISSARISIEVIWFIAYNLRDRKMLAVLAFIALYSSVDGFQTGRMSSRALRMSSEEAWFPASVTSNVVEFDSLRLLKSTNSIKSNS